MSWIILNTTLVERAYLHRRLTTYTSRIVTDKRLVSDLYKPFPRRMPVCTEEGTEKAPCGKAGRSLALGVREPLVTTHHSYTDLV